MANSFFYNIKIWYKNTISCKFQLPVASGIDATYSLAVEIIVVKRWLVFKTGMYKYVIYNCQDFHYETETKKIVDVAKIQLKSRKECCTFKVSFEYFFFFFYKVLMSELETTEMLLKQSHDLLKFHHNQKVQLLCPRFWCHESHETTEVF